MPRSIARVLTVATIALALHGAVPALAHAEPAHKSTAAAAYMCPGCKERVSVAQARKQHMQCACCKEKLVPVAVSHAKARKS